MLLELYGFEENIRARQVNIAHEVEAYRLRPEAGQLRRLFGTVLVRVGESIRGTARTSGAQGTITVARQG